MAISLRSADDSNELRVVSSIDDAVGCDEETYEQYLETLDESLLDLDPDKNPVRFVLKKMFNEAERQHVNKAKVKTSKKGRPEANVDFVIDEMEVALKAIEDPSGALQAKFDGRGRCDRELLNQLDQAGVLNELHQARSNSFKRGNGPLKKS